MVLDQPEASTPVLLLSPRGSLHVSLGGSTSFHVLGGSVPSLRYSYFKVGHSLPSSDMEGVVFLQLHFSPS